MTEAALTIGEVARQAGLKTSAIRYYESVGLLPAPDRVGGQRRYDGDTLRRLRVIDVAKRAGFSLDEARVLLTAGDGDHLRALAERKLPEVDDLIARAEAMRAWLVTASGCTCATLDVCALFERDDGAPPELRITHVGG